jgi:hypothetical protein
MNDAALDNWTSESVGIAFHDQLAVDVQLEGFGARPKLTLTQDEAERLDCSQPIRNESMKDVVQVHSRPANEQRLSDAAAKLIEGTVVHGVR